MREVLNSLVLTCSLEAKAGEVEITFTNMAGAAVHVKTVQWSRPLTMRRIRKVAIDYAILTEQVRSQNQVVVVVEGCCKQLPASAVLWEGTEKAGPPKHRLRKKTNLNQAQLQDRLRRVCKDGLATKRSREAKRRGS